MTALTGYNGRGVTSSRNTAITDDLADYATDYWPTHQDSLVAPGESPRTSPMPVIEHPDALPGWKLRGYFEDFYYRIWITPPLLALGNVVTEQVRPVSVWNAWPDEAVTLASLTVDANAGLTLEGQPAPPFVMQPMQALVWNVRMGLTGAATIDTTVVWTFTGKPAPTLRITGNRTLSWWWRPDWTKGILETMEWRTDIIPAQQDTEQRIAMRDTPRQTWEFSVSAEGTARQTLVNAMIGMQLNRWAVPQWPHGASLGAPAAAGTDLLTLPTFGRGFAVGGMVMLIDDDTTAHETGEVLAITSGTIQTKLPLTKSWRAGSTIAYPAKTSMVDDPGAFEHFTGVADDFKIRFLTDEPVPHDAVVAMPLYRGVPVLEDIPDWSTAPTLKAARSVAALDNQTSLPVKIDLTGIPMLTQGHSWTPVGRAQLERIRSLQYLLKGARGALWIPTWMQDFTLTADSIPATATLRVANAGYAGATKAALHRRDIRIASAQGVIYRRITNAVQVSDTEEGLTLDSNIAYALSAAPGAVTISFMAVWRQTSDRQEWAWWSGDMTGDLASADVPMTMRTFNNDV